MARGALFRLVADRIVLPPVFVCPLVVAVGLMLAVPIASAQSPQPSVEPAPVVQQSPQGASSGGVDARAVANQVNNPAAPVTLIQFRNILLPDVSGTDGVTNELQIQPVLPLGPFASLPFLQLVKVTLPFPSLPSPVSVGGVGDLQVFDLVSIEASWGRWGFGPALVFPTASDQALGQGKWQAGPAVAAIFTGVKNLTAGAILQNPISYAGGSDRADVNNLIITPTLTYNLPHGWFAGMSDFNWTFDWENDGAATILLGVQVGRIISIGKQMVSLSFEAGGAAAQPSTTPGTGWILGIEITPVFKGHIK